MTSSKGMPFEIKKNIKMKQGHDLAFRNKQKQALSWEDKTIMTILSTFHVTCLLFLQIPQSSTNIKTKCVGLYEEYGQYGRK
jgi:hypothetical protein